jgi:phospholipase C
MRSDYWYKSAFMWTYDDWGGWYDHVPPPQVDEHGYGFRAPALVVSPYAKRGHIERTVTDFTSILRFIEDNWGLPSMAERDAKANSIAGAFDFNQEPREPRFISASREVETKPPSRRAALYFIYGLLVAVPALALGWRANRRMMKKRGQASNVRDRWQ